jgi:hypothetical protein
VLLNINMFALAKLGERKIGAAGASAALGRASTMLSDAAFRAS